MTPKFYIIPLAIMGVGAWLLLLPGLFWLVGAPLGAAGFCLSWLRWKSGESWSYSACCAGLLWLGLELLFRGILHTQPYRGLLAAWLG